MATTSGLTIAVDGTELPETAALQLVSSCVDTHAGLPDAVVLRFRDNARRLLADATIRIGSSITVKITTDANAATTLFVGDVVAVEAEFEASGTFTIVRGYDQSHRLYRGRHTAAYMQATASDAATQCARRVGLRPGRIEPSSTVYEHISQRGETDWEFLSALARDIGYRVGVRDGALDFAPPDTADTGPDGDPEDPLVLRFGADITRLRATITAAEQVGRVEVRGWDVATKQPIVATAEPSAAGADTDRLTPASLAEVFGNRVHIDGDRGVRSQAQADAAAGARSEAIAGGYAEIDASCRGNPVLRAGVVVMFTDLGAPFDGRFVLTSARHRYEPAGGYTTTIGVSAAQDRSLLALTADRPGPANGGVVIGQVTDVADPEAQGRVRLAFPQLSADYVSGWARVALQGAGKDRGNLVLPEVGDEVLVVFEQGDGDHPYVLGGLFNGVDTPDKGGVELIDSGSGAVNRRSFVSRRGHRIDLNDRDGRTEGVVLATGDDALRVELDAVNRAVTIRSSGTVTIRGDSGVAIDGGAGEVTVRGGRVAVNATGAAEVTASGPLTARGTPIKLN